MDKWKSQLQKELNAGNEYIHEDFKDKRKPQTI